MIELSIIIVTWKSKELIGDCVRSIRLGTDLTYEVIIVDNNSQDGTIELIEEQFPNCKLIKLTQNIGFSKANNIGIGQARGKNILLLNPDVVVNDGAIQNLLKSFEADTTVGIVGPRVLNPDGTLQLCSPRRIPSLFTEFLNLAELGRFFPKGRITNRYRYGNWRHNTEMETEVISGCCMLIRREVFEGVRGLDEDFFFGGEDIHFCWKARQAGWKVLFVPRAEITHFLSKSLEKQPDRMRRTDLDSMYKVFHKLKGIRYAQLYGIEVGLLNLVWLVMEWIRYLFLKESKKKLFRSSIFPKHFLALNWAIAIRKNKVASASKKAEEVNNQRYQLEQLYFDREYAKLRQGANLDIPDSEIERYRNPIPRPLYGRSFSFRLLGDVSAKKVLDYGCGDGDSAIFLAKKGAWVTAIDCSGEAVDLTLAKAKANGVEDIIRAIQMDCEKTDFANEEFDCIIGNAILHHLNLDRAKDEVYRILKKGGIAVFREPVIFDRVLAIIRKMIPYRHSNITPDERPLSYADIKSFGEKFREMKWWPFELISRIEFLFRNRCILKFLFELDYYLIKNFPFMRRFASCIVIRCIK